MSITIIYKMKPCPYCGQRIRCYAAHCDKKECIEKAAEKWWTTIERKARKEVEKGGAQ